MAGVRVVTVKLPGWLALAAREAAAARRVSLSELVREAAWRLVRSPPARLEAPRSAHRPADECLTAKMPGALLEKLDRLARAYGANRSTLLREALWRHLARLGILPEKPPEPKVIRVLG